METPKYFRFKRQEIGVMDTSKRVIEASAAVITLSEYPWVSAILIGIRVGLSFVISASDISNPLEEPPGQPGDVASPVSL